MLSLTRRSIPEANLPKAAWHSCVRPNVAREGLQAGRLPVGGLETGLCHESYRRTNIVTVATSLGTTDCAGIVLAPAGQAPADRPFQDPEALP
jgi:hypothetical protein